MKRLVIGLLLMALGMPFAMAQNQLKPAPFSVERMYFGGGVNMNKLSGFDDAMGYQFLLGYDLGMRVDKLGLGVEIGYLNSGKFEDTIVVGPLVVKVDEELRGPWAAAVVNYRFIKQMEVLGRLGYDGGDDKGPMFGAGVGYWPIRNLGIRGEVVIRDDMDSFQINVLFQP